MAGLILFAGIMVTIVLPISNANNAQYHKSMSGLDLSARASASATKAVTYSEETFSTNYIPDQLKAKSPEEVRYVIYWEQDEILVGTYSNGAGAFQYVYSFEIVDLTTGKTIGSESFSGGNPPQSTSKGAKHGSVPDRERIESWVDSVTPG